MAAGYPTPVAVAATPPPVTAPPSSPSAVARYGAYGLPSAAPGPVSASYGAVPAPQSAPPVGYSAAPASYGGASAYGSAVAPYGPPGASYGFPDPARGSMASVPAPMTPLSAQLASTAPMEPFGGLGPVTRLGAGSSRSGKKNDTWIALAAIGAMFVVLGIAIALWLGRRGAEGDTAVTTDGPAMGDGAGTAKPASPSKPKPGKGPKKPSPRGATTIIIPIGPHGEPMPGHVQGDGEEE